MGPAVESGDDSKRAGMAYGQHSNLSAAHPTISAQRYTVDRSNNVCSGVPQFPVKIGPEPVHLAAAVPVGLGDVAFDISLDAPVDDSCEVSLGVSLGVSLDVSLRGEELVVVSRPNISRIVVSVLSHATGTPSLKICAPAGGITVERTASLGRVWSSSVITNTLDSVSGALLAQTLWRVSREDQTTRGRRNILHPAAITTESATHGASPISGSILGLYMGMLN